MSARGGSISAMVRVAAGGAHAVALLAALVVPVFAAWQAVAGLGRGGEAVATLGNGARWLHLLGTTGTVSGLALLVAWVGGGGLALLAARTDLPGRRVLMGAALLGACVPVYISSVFVFSWFSLTALNSSRVGCGLLCGVVYAPLAMLVLGAAFRAADHDAEDQALLDGSAWQVITRVTIPQAAWGFVAVALLVIVLVGTDFTIPDLLFVRTFAEECYSQYQLDHRRVGPLLTGLPVLGALVTLLAVAHARYHAVGEPGGLSPGGAARTYRLGRWRWGTALVCAVVVLGSAGVLVVSLALKLWPPGDLARAVASFAGELGLSAELGLLGATLIVLPAPGLAWGLARGGWRRWVVGAGVLVLLSVPAPVVGISLLELLNRPGVEGLAFSPQYLALGGRGVCVPPLGVVCGYFVRFLPIGILLVLPAVRRVPRELEWAARVDGCGWLREHWHVRWPAVRRDAVVAWLIVLILCFGEIGATMLLAAPGWEPASVRAYSLLHFGVYRDLAALAVLVVACILVPWGLLAWLLRRTKDGT